MIFKTAVLAIALIGLAACASSTSEIEPAPEQLAASRPNIVLILADDLGWSDVSAYGLQRVPTPNIDRIAERGVAFTNGYVTSPACAPSRAGLMTGRYPQTFGFEFNMFPQDGTRGLPQSESTIAELLQANGYKTSLVGKWHQGVQQHQYPTNRGFDEFFGFLSGTITYIDKDAPGIVNAKPEQAPETAPRDTDSQVLTGRDAEIVENFDRYLTHELTREAVDFIERDHSEPFFLYLAHHAPHRPLQVPREYYDRFTEVGDHDRRVYMAMISAMDDGIGEVLDALEEKGIRENTLVIFLSDNGCPSRFEVCDCSSLINAGKFTHLEGGIRVPFLMSWPAEIAEGMTVHEPVISIDVFPTLAVASGAMWDDTKIHGTDLISALSRNDDTLSKRALFWRQQPVKAVRQGKWKLVDSGPALPIALYDLEADPGETTNLATSYPELVASLSAEVSVWEAARKSPDWDKFFQATVDVCERRAEAVY